MISPQHKSDSFHFRIRIHSGWDLTPSRAMVLSFAAIILVTMMAIRLPMCLAPGKEISLVDSLFMATSAVCVTGLTTIDVSSDFSFIGQCVLLFFVQVGGLGVVLFSSSVFLMLGGRLGLRGRKMIQEFLPGISLTGVVRLTRYIVVFIFLSELAGMVALSAVWIPQFGLKDGLFFALFHSVMAMCGAGFSIFPNGLIDVADQYIPNIVVMILIIFGSLGFLVITDVVNIFMHPEDRKRMSLHTRIVIITSLALSFLGALGIYFFELHHPAIGGNSSVLSGIMAAFFQSITSRSAGFSTVDIASLQEETRQLIMFLMFIGGGPGSTAGGIKVTTFALLMMATWAQFMGRSDIEVGNRRVSWNRIIQASALTVICIMAVVSVVVVLNYCEAMDFSNLMFEAISALGTVGLSTGVTPNLTDFSKIVLCVSMFVGRVGPLTLAASLISGPDRAHKRLPEGEVIIG